MQLSTPAPTALRPAAPAPTTGENPWRFPALDTAVAQSALTGIEATETMIDRMIDRSITVRVMLDRDLKAGTFGTDSARAVDLLVRARSYARDQLASRDLPDALLGTLTTWIKQAAAADRRLVGAFDDLDATERALDDFLDDDEGNVGESIRDMKSSPDRETWSSVRASLDAGIAELYGLRGVFTAPAHVIRSAGSLY